jgi:hypothetical protein
VHLKFLQYMSVVMTHEVWARRLLSICALSFIIEVDSLHSITLPVDLQWLHDCLEPLDCERHLSEQRQASLEVVYRVH